MTVLRWIARLGGLGLAAYLVTLLVRQHLDGELATAEDGMSRERVILLTLFGAACAGLLLAWRFEGFGSLLTLVAVAAIYLVERSATGRFPAALGIAALAVPALLLLLCRVFAPQRPGGTDG